MTFSETTREKIPGKSFICFDFQKTFHVRDVFCDVSSLFVLLGFRLCFACMAVHFFAVYFALGGIAFSIRPI